MCPAVGASQLCCKLFNRSSEFEAHRTLQLDSQRGPKVAEAVILGAILSALTARHLTKILAWLLHWDGPKVGLLLIP